MDFLKPVQTQRGMLSPIGVERIPTPSLLPRDDDIIELLRSNDFDIRLQVLFFFDISGCHFSYHLFTDILISTNITETVITNISTIFGSSALIS